MYKNLKKLYDETNRATFSMAVSHLIDIGFRAAKEITDEDIEEIEGNGLMTKEFVQDLIRITKEIAVTCESPAELVQFCQVVELFDVKWYKGEENEDDE